MYFILFDGDNTPLKCQGTLKTPGDAGRRYCLAK